MSNDTGSGRGPAHGSNENHDSDPRTRTMGEEVSRDEPPAGNDLIDEVRPMCSRMCRAAANAPQAEFLSVASYATSRRP